MSSKAIAETLDRVEAVMRRRPASGLHDDAPASARWVGGMRVVARHDNGHEVATDMPVELGGSGDRVSPGWLLRAGLASCTATCIAMHAARRRIELASLEVHVTSRSDTRGMLQMSDARGGPVYAGPLDMALHVRIAADGVDAGRLRALVEETCRASPMTRALLDAVPLAVEVEVDATIGAH